jgi:hypothetical protein
MHVQGRVSMCVCWLPPMTPDLRQRSINTRTSSQKLAATVYGDYIYTSTDSGATWTAQTNAGGRVWRSIASSSDGAVRSTGADDTTHTHTLAVVWWMNACTRAGQHVCLLAATDDA